jgi:hypothetical protein
MKIDGEETTLPGLLMTFVFSAALRVGAFVVGWHLGVALTGVDVGGLAGALFIALSGDITMKFWTQ